MRLPDLYTFSSSDIAQPLNLDEDKVSTILDKYAFEWGALSEHDAEHFHLSNPIWTKPVIKLDDGKYFYALHFGFFSFVIPCIESLLSSFKDKVSKRRAEYLESKVAEIVAKQFSDSKIKRNFQWLDNGITYETDLVVFIDSFALVIECKSGRITLPALRGAPKTLRKHIKQLLIDPNLQSLRLKNRLEFLISNPSAVDPIRDEIGYDLSKLHRIVRVSVCLDDFGLIQSCLKQFDGTHWLPTDFKPCPTMNLADFETVFDILEHPVQILDYMMKREIIETSLDYLASETDLSGLYLTTFLNIDNSEHESQVLRDFTDMSSPLDSYYSSIDAGITINKPQPKISPLFASIFSQLEQRKIARWTEIGMALNMFSPDDQVKITEELMRIEKRFNQNRGVRDHENTLIYTPSKASKYALGYVILKNEEIGERAKFMQNVADTTFKDYNVKRVIVIAKNIDKCDIIYSTIGIYESFADMPK